MIVKFFANVRDITKSKEIEVKAPDDIMQLLLLMSEKYGKDMKAKLLLENRLHPDMIVLLNGRHIEHLQEERSKLSDDDTVSFFPRIAGG
jgi:sulfur-carrier protein